MDKPAPLALVTGASSGIGLELARCHARDGHHLLLIAHDPARLEEAAATLRGEGSPEVTAWSFDLADPASAPALFEQVRTRFGIPDYLVLNAGTGAWGKFLETDLALELASIQVNITSVVQSTKLFLPEMVKRGAGRVLITSSLVALGPSPKLAVYSGTKAFLHHFAEAVREEIAGSGVTITALMPDLTESGFFQRAGVDPNSLTAREPKADPAIVAQDGYHAMMKGKDHVITPAFSKLKAAAANVLPDRILTKITRAD
jgi:uncharacterized protein